MNFRTISSNFVANTGGLMGLCMGFSLLSAIEFIYWFILRWSILLLKRKKNGDLDKDKQDCIDENIRETEKKVFDEVFETKKPRSATMVAPANVE